MKIWLGILSIVILIQWIKIYSLQDDIERIKSWYPFVELCKMKIPKTFYKNNIKIKTKEKGFKTAEKEEDKDDGEINRT